MLRTSAKHIVGAALIAAFTIPAATALAQEGPPMVWRHDISPRVEKDRIKKYGIGPYADGQTRLETELRTDVSMKRLPGIRKALDKLTKNDGEAAKVFGKDHRVRPMAPKPRKVWDLYVDTPKGDLAKNGASLRIRIENGTAQINYKPPGGEFFSEGMKIGLEAGITVQADANGKLPAKTIDFLRNTRLVDNPMRELKKQFPGMDPGDFFHLQMEVKQSRKMYEVQKQEGGMWVKVSEVAVDAVTARDPQSKKWTRFGRVELEGDHVSAGQLNARQQAALQGSTWKGPHKAKDVKNPAFAKSPDVKHIRGLGVKLTNYLKIKPVKDSKYVAGRARLAKRGVKVGTGPNMIRGLTPAKPKSSSSTRTQTSRQQVKAKAKAQAKTQAKARSPRVKAKAR